MEKIAIWEITGFIFTVIAGTLLHFVYNWSGHKWIVGIFSPVNESTWEHLKLLFTPMLLYSTVEYFVIGKDYPNFIFAKSFGIAFGMLVILIAFYTYTGIIGSNFLWADILTFLLGVAAAYFYSWRVIYETDIGTSPDFIGAILLLLLTLCFVLFTFTPPHIGMFLDPVSKEYGIPKNRANSVSKIHEE